MFLHVNERAKHKRKLLFGSVDLTIILRMMVLRITMFSIISEDAMTSLIQIYSRVQKGNRSGQTTAHGRLLKQLSMPFVFNLIFIYCIVKHHVHSDKYSRSILPMDNLGRITLKFMWLLWL